jgi:polar amino acid transport system ATP-binding protein
VLGVITKLKEEDGIACILVTHDMAFAAKAADRLAYFEDGVIAEELRRQKLLVEPETEGLRNFVAAVRL